jgi:hypothetical protein
VEKIGRRRKKNVSEFKDFLKSFGFLSLRYGRKEVV